MNGEVHNLKHPDGEGKVDDDNGDEDEDDEVQASFPPAIDAYLVDDLGVG